MTAAARRPFDIERVLALVREAVRPFAKAAMFQLADEGYRSPFEQLVACIVSIRTLDETTIPVAHALFAAARTPAEVLRLGPARIEALIAASTFAPRKARQIHDIARRALDELDGRVPCDFDVLTGFAGVGPKCANLVLAVACGQQRISVDVHVHRVTNRWGYVAARTPEASLAALERRLPRAHWSELNALLVPFGKHVCTGALPRCSTCPVLAYCRQVGVGRRR